MSSVRALHTVAEYRRWVHALPPVDGDNEHALLRAQGNRCATCGRERNLRCDHDHVTGLVRGWLCHQCNVAEGNFAGADVFDEYRNWPPAAQTGLRMRYRDITRYPSGTGKEDSVPAPFVVDRSGIARLSLAAARRPNRRARRSTDTLHTYKRAWHAWERWCDANGRTALPASPKDVRDFARAEEARDMAPGTIIVRICAISAYHETHGHPDPTYDPDVGDAVFRAKYRKAARAEGKPPRRATPVTLEMLSRMVAACPASAAGRRDTAVLLIGFSAALSRSDIASIRLSDLERADGGLLLTVHGGRGRVNTVAVPYGADPGMCPVAAYEGWLHASQGIRSDDPDRPLFLPVDRHGKVRGAALSGAAIGEIVKRAAERARFDARDITGHSLRDGLINAADAAGVHHADIARTSRHNNTDMVKRCIRDANPFDRNAAAAVL